MDSLARLNAYAMLAELEPRRLARGDPPISTVDPVDDQSAVLVRCFLPGEVTCIERMDLAVGKEVVEVLVVGPRHEVAVAVRDDLGGSSAA